MVRGDSTNEESPLCWTEVRMNLPVDEDLTWGCHQLSNGFQNWKGCQVMLRLLLTTSEPQVLPKIMLGVWLDGSAPLFNI